MKRLIAVIALGLGMLGTSWAAIDMRDFTYDAQRQRYYDLATVLRCPKCQNQNIAESSAPIAGDLRAEIQRMLGEGRSDEEIIDFMVARYGDFVLYDPPLSARTALLWLGPALLLLAGGLTVLVIVASRRKARSIAAGGLSGAERRYLASLLREINPSVERDQ
jgi:cytochrome c-type biogenesis protein CcmH